MVRFTRGESEFESVWNATETPLCFLNVLEILVTGGRGKCLARTTSPEQVSSSLSALGPPSEGTVRIYIEENAEIASLFAHLESLLDPQSADLDHTSRFKDNVTVGENVRALIAQGTSAPLWLHTEHIHSSNIRTMKEVIYHKPHSLRGAVKTKMSVRSMCLDRQGMIILISAKSVHSDSFCASEAPNEAIRMLDACSEFLLDSHVMFKPAMDPALSQRTCVWLVILQYLHFHLMQVDAFIGRVDTKYSVKMNEQWNPQQVSLTQSILSEVAAGALFCEDLRNISLTTTDLVSYAVDILSEGMEDSIATQQAIRSKRAEIRAECYALARLSSRLVERFESRIRFFELFRSTQDSVSIFLSTLLACLFLPLSLASGILSMQTRFAELRFLLYDFCGVITIIGSLIAIVFLGLKLAVLVVDQLVRIKVKIPLWKRVMAFVYWPAVRAVALVFLALWVVVFTSFMVGMIKDVGLGLKILGYGCAAYLGVVMVFGFATLSIGCFS